MKIEPTTIYQFGLARPNTPEEIRKLNEKNEKLRLQEGREAAEAMIRNRVIK